MKLLQFECTHRIYNNALSMQINNNSLLMNIWRNHWNIVLWWDIIEGEISKDFYEDFENEITNLIPSDNLLKDILEKELKNVRS